VRRTGRAAVLGAVVIALLGGATQAAAAPPPPPNPGDAALARSHAAVTARAAQVSTLTGQLADLDAKTDDIQADLAAKREDAENAMQDLSDAQAAAADAARKADGAKVATDAAGRAVDDARARLDVFVTATYQQGLDTGPFGLLTGAVDPSDLVDRAAFSDIVASSELAAQDGLERARVDQANAQSLARAAQAEAERRAQAAVVAKQRSDAALGVANAAAEEQARQLAAVAAQRAAVQAQLDAAVAQDAALKAQRQRFVAWQAQVAAELAARQQADRNAALGRLRIPPILGGGSVQRAIDRALSQVGVQYVWGGGGARGPSTGIPDAFGSPLNRVGFDCSGLMQYAYGGAGVALPRTSRNQYNAGRKVPISDLRPGDLVFYQRPGGPIHHVAMYIGNGDMVEAPYTGADVRVVPLRRGGGLLPQATRLI
jgi:peptidoglycan DL-endopeptidase RipA